LAIWSSPDGCSETDGNTGVIKTYQYDANQRMVGFSNGRTADDAQDITYRYNPDGIRTKTIIGGSSTDYIVDSNRDYAQVIAEQVNSTEIAKEYVFGYDLLSQNTAVVIDGAADGETQTDTAFYHYDSLGTTRNLSNDSGIITDDYFYEAFGDLLASTGTTDNDYLYTGEQYDAALDNYYLRARYYHQGVGRFTQMDEWYGKPCTPLTLNKYLYVHSDPLNGIDLSGYMRISDVKVASYGQAKIRTATVESRVSVFSGKTKGRQVNLKRQVGCFIGKQFIDAKRDKVEGHHPLQQSIGGAERQVLLSTAKMTHQLLHTVQNMLFREAGLPPLNTSAARFESFFSSNPGTRRLAFNTAITAAKRVDQFCGYKGKTSFESNIKREMKRWIKSNDLL
jgi:RHS repeat-associated protein